MRYPTYPEADAVWSTNNSVREITPDTASNPDTETLRPSAEALDDAGLHLLARLRDRVDLTCTARRCPRIVNQLATLWPERAFVMVAIDRLLIDDRPHREGITFEVLRELAALKAYCSQPRQKSTSEIAPRRR